jgi:hypothetical protein
VSEFFSVADFVDAAERLIASLEREHAKLCESGYDGENSDIDAAIERAKASFGNIEERFLDIEDGTVPDSYEDQKWLRDKIISLAKNIVQISMSMEELGYSSDELSEDEDFILVKNNSALK